MTHRRTFLKTMAVGSGMLVGSRVLAAEMPKPRGDVFNRIPLENVRLEGYLGRKIDSVIENRIFAQDLRELIEPFRTRPDTTCWTSEFWGKWFVSAVDACRYTQNPAHRQIVDRAARELMATQTPDGYIGTYAEKNRLSTWDVWGRKYTLLGLLSYYDLTGDKAVLAAASRHADHLLTEVGPGKANIVRIGNFRGMASSSVLEPILLLYRHTRQARYLDFARYIVGQWSTPDGPYLVEKAGVPVAERFPKPAKWWTWENGQKAYEMMSCYEGLIELIRETDDPEHLVAVLKTISNIQATEITVIGSGASVECWYGGKARQTEPAMHMSETCVTMTWMKLCENLLRLTGESTLVDQVETSGYNALLGAMKPDGSIFSKYSSLAGVRELGEHQCNTSLNCCTANGPRAMMQLAGMAYMSSMEGPVINLYAPGKALVPLANGNRVALQVQTDYPESGLVRVEVRPERPESFAMSLRIPGWSAQTELRVNGESLATEPGKYARITRAWKPGDMIELRLDVRGRVVHSPGERHVHAAVLRGPIVLARDARVSGSDLDAPVKSTPGTVSLERVTQAVPRDVWMAHKYQNQVLVDYASAGNTWDERSHYRVWQPVLLDPSSGEV